MASPLVAPMISARGKVGVQVGCATRRGLGWACGGQGSLGVGARRSVRGCGARWSGCTGGGVAGSHAVGLRQYLVEQVILDSLWRDVFSGITKIEEVTNAVALAVGVTD